MTIFDEAFLYMLENEGIDSDHPLDSGGRTRYGITREVATLYGYDVETLTLEQAKTIYRKGYWRGEGIRDRKVAIKHFDIGVNVGIKTAAKLLQRAVKVTDDGIIGPVTLDAINSRNPEDVLESLSMALSDYYVDIVRRKPNQIVFLKGWMRRAIRRPRTVVHGVT